MTREDVIRMAHKSGAAEFYPSTQQVKEQNYIVSKGFLERFAAEVTAMVRADEREKCAQIADSSAKDDWLDNHCCIPLAKDIAEAIRSRGQEGI